MKVKRGWLTAIAASLAILLVACGGNQKSDRVSSESRAIDQASLVMNLSKVAEPLSRLQSFRFQFSLSRDFGNRPPTLKLPTSNSGGLANLLFNTVGDLKAEGQFVAPDHMAMDLSFGASKLSMIQLGTRSWTRYGSDWKEGQGAASLGLGQSPADLLKMLPNIDLLGGQSSLEQTNGVIASHYQFTKEALGESAKALGVVPLTSVSQAKVDLWLTETNIPVRLIIDVSGKDESNGQFSSHFELNLTDLNGSGIKIEPPG